MYVYLSEYYKTELHKWLASILYEFVENKSILCSYSTMKIIVVIVNNSIMEMNCNSSHFGQSQCMPYVYSS